MKKERLYFRCKHIYVKDGGHYCYRDNSRCDKNRDIESCEHYEEVDQLW